MNIVQEKISDLNTVVKIRVTSEDYKGRVETSVKNYQKKASIPGFRPGKVPAGIIQKMYGKSILVDELNKLLSESLSKYITDNKLPILGGPMPDNKQNSAFDWDNPSDFEFLYELGLAPSFEVKIPGKISVPYYAVTADDEMMEKYIADIRRRYGDFQNPELSEETDILYGEFTELESGGLPSPKGITATTTMAIEYITDAEEKKKFVGLKKDATVEFNISKAINNPSEIAAMLRIDKEVAAGLQSDFRLAVKTINRVVKAEVNQALFDKVYGEGVVKSEEEFRNKVRTEIEAMFVKDTEDKLHHDVMDGLLAANKIPLPDEFLKRWLLTATENPITPEQVEKEYGSYARELRWRLIESGLITKNNITATPEELKTYARSIAAGQFAKYGYYNVEDSRLDEISSKYLDSPEQLQKIEHALMGNKVFEYLKTVLKLDKKPVSYKEFINIVNAHHHHD